MKRVIFITGNKYPAGDAGAIRQHAMAKCFQNAGCHVFIYSMGESTNGKSQVYDGIEYMSMHGNKTDKLSRLFNRVVWGKRALKDLHNRFDQIDAIILIDDNPWLFRAAEKIGKKHDCKLIHDCVEWYSPEEFKLGKLDIRYRLKNHVNTKVINKNWDVISISQYLYNWFADRCHRTVKIPVILDMFDIDEVNSSVNNNNEKIVFTYAGSPLKKDYIAVILNGFSLLDKELLDKVEIHIIGVNKDQLITACGVDKTTVDLLGFSLFIHGRVPHEEAVSWVRKADFTLLLRDENQRYAKAGFPTKIVESLKYGTPPICNLSSDLGQYLVDQKNAIIIDGCNSESVEKAIRTALQMDVIDRASMRKAARETAVQNFDYRIYSETLLGMIID